MKLHARYWAIALLAATLAAIGLVQAYRFIAGRNLHAVRQDLQKIFGADLTFDGLEVKLLPRPGFSATGIRLADDPRFAATPILRTGELILGVNLWSLLQGRILIDSLIFMAPELQLIIDEAGANNLTALTERRQGLREFPQIDSAATERRSPSAARFAIREVRVVEGKIEYLDRSVYAPAELQVRNIDLALRGLRPDKSTTIALNAALSEGLNRDVRIEGEIAPQAADQTWSRRPVELSVRFNSLYMPVIARAVAALRERFPRALNVTGPMALEAKVSGTVERPKIEKFSLKIPLFGSSDYNAVVTGAVAFTERRTWSSAELDGKVSLKGVDLDRMGGLPGMEQLLSPAVSAAGAADIFARFQGTWDSLRVGALMIADKAEIRYQNWLRKPAGVPAEIRTQISRRMHKYQVHDSALTAGALKTTFSGIVETEPDWRLSLQLTGQQDSPAGWNELLAPSSIAATAGQASWRLTAERSFESGDAPWILRGDIRLAGVSANQKGGGWKIQDLNGRLSFLGRQARFEQVSFGIGATKFLLDATAEDLFGDRVEFQLRSPAFDSADLPGLRGAPIKLKDMSGKGQFTWDGGGAILSGSFAAPEGAVGSLSLRHFRTHFTRSAQGAYFENLSAQIFNGTLRSTGRWIPDGDKGGHLTLRWDIESMDVDPFVAQLIPALKNRLQGRLQSRGELSSESAVTKGDAISAAANMSIERGQIGDFNLVRHLLQSGSGASPSDESLARWPRGFADLARTSHTAFDSIHANFVFEQQRFRTDDLVVTTPDYTVTGAGWIGLDRSMRWNGLLVLSPRLTQEVQREYRVLRYLLDRRGRLSISFRAEGALPNITVRLENRALAQLLRGGASREDGEDGSETAGRPRKNWLPDSVERFLNR